MEETNFKRIKVNLWLPSNFHYMNLFDDRFRVRELDDDIFVEHLDIPAHEREEEHKKTKEVK